MRGQVAFIAIIGALIIVGAIGTFLIFSYEPEPPTPPANEERFSIEQCATLAFEESLSLVALYGGLYEPHPHYIENGYTFDMSGRTFALWASDVEIPSSSQLATEVESALLDRIDACSEGLEGPRTATVDVQLGASRNRAAIEIDAWIPGESSDERLSGFVVESSLPVLRAHNVAEDFTRELWEDEVLTDLNFNLLALNPDVPLDGGDFSCTPKRWSVDEVREEFFSSVQDVVPHVSFDGTARVTDDQLKPKVTFKLDSLPDDVSVSSYYFTEFGGELDVEQSSGDQMTSFVTRSGDGSLCQNTYQFWYSMNYPIVFTLTVPHQDGGFLYRFAVPVGVSRNVKDDVTPSDSSFCSDVTPRTFSLELHDADSGDSLDDVRATFVCGSNRCPLASVSGAIEDHLPSRCMSATILLDKEGYERKELEYRYDEPLSGSTIELEPLRSITIECTDCDAFEGLFFARIDGSSTPLRIGENYVENGDLELLVLENPGSGPIITCELEPTSDDPLIIAVDGAKYGEPDYGLTQIFPTGIDPVLSGGCT